MISFGLELISQISHTTQRLGVRVQHTNLLFAGFEDVTIRQEEGLHLVDTAWRNENEIENGKESQLKGECAVSNFPEGEATEKSRENMKDDLVPHVILERVLASKSIPLPPSGLIIPETSRF